MSITVFFILMIVLIVSMFLFGVMLYNNLVEIKNNIKRNWSNIDVLLKQRHDELPKLIESCKQYMTHEQDTLTKVMEARSAVMSAKEKQSMPALGQAESQLRMGLGNLFAVAENYPDLKANQSFMQLQSRITSLENTIADRRELYNDSVTINNTRIEQFPDYLIARRYRFKTVDLLEFSSEETKDVNVKHLFNN